MFHFQSFQPSDYLRLHGYNRNWLEANSAAEHHDYRYTDIKLQQLAETLYHHRGNFETLSLYFQNTTNSYSFYNIQTVKGYLKILGFQLKTEIDEMKGEQQSLF